MIEFLTVKGLKFGGLYRHFKGGEYIVDKLDNDEVVYHSTIDGAEYRRPLKEFLDYVERENYKGPRFVLIG